MSSGEVVRVRRQLNKLVRLFETKDHRNRCQSDQRPHEHENKKRGQRAQRAWTRRRCKRFVIRTHLASSFSPNRINCAVSALSPAPLLAAAIAAAACG